MSLDLREPDLMRYDLEVAGQRGEVVWPDIRHHAAPELGVPSASLVATTTQRPSAGRVGVSWSWTRPSVNRSGRDPAPVVVMTGRVLRWVVVERVVLAATTHRLHYQIGEKRMADHHRLMLSEWRRELAAAEAARQEIEARCSRLQAGIELLEETIQSAVVEEESNRDAGMYAMMSMPDAIRHCLSDAKRPLAKREVMVILRDRGKPAGRLFSQSVYNTLYRMSRDGSVVRHAEDGLWSLPETANAGQGGSLLTES